MNQFDSRGRRPRGPSSGPGRGRGPSPDRRPPFRPRRPPTTQERFADARGMTFEALGTFENRRAFVSDALEQLFYERSALPSDKGLATEMSYGIARRIATVDALLNAACSRPQDMVQDGLWRLMRIGAYQLAWLQSIPAHAAIHETVELCCDDCSETFCLLIKRAGRASGHWQTLSQTPIRAGYLCEK